MSEHSEWTGGAAREVCIGVGRPQKTMKRWVGGGGLPLQRVEVLLPPRKLEDRKLEQHLGGGEVLCGNPL